MHVMYHNNKALDSNMENRNAIQKNGKKHQSVS